MREPCEGAARSLMSVSRPCVGQEGTGLWGVTHRLNPCLQNEKRNTITEALF